jgi:hypothetical protein
MMLGLIGFSLLILFRVSSRTPTIACSRIPGIATEVGSSIPNPQTGEMDCANRSSKLAA